MVCAKCQKKLKQTELATPGVKRKTEMYYGSPATTLGGSSSSSSSSGAGAGAAGGKAKSSTLGSTGIGKVCIVYHLFYSLSLLLLLLLLVLRYMMMMVMMVLILYRANSSAPKPRTPTRRMLPPVRFAKPRRSRGGSIVSGVRIRRMVRFLSFYITIEG